MKHTAFSMANFLQHTPCCIYACAGGGAWNHALYFKHLAPAGSANAATTAISADLSKAITSSFGGVAKMQEELTTAATKQFGSGWAWLCYTGVCKTQNRVQCSLMYIQATRVFNSLCTWFLVLQSR